MGRLPASPSFYQQVKLKVAMTSQETDQQQGPSGLQVPLQARIMLSHAHLQHLAQEADLDILHIKGYIFGSDTYPRDRASTDVDVLVRPQHLEAFIEATRQAGWKAVTSFASGSDFHHAMTIYHPVWGLADIHRSFPGLGLGTAQAFEALWSQRRLKKMGGFPCQTTSLVDSWLLVYIHSARSTLDFKPDVRYLNSLLSSRQREAVAQRVEQLGAELAYAAALGTLDRYSDHPDYLFWKAASEPTTEVTRWYARVKNAPTFTEKLRTFLDIIFVNRDHLAMKLGHEPSAQEVCQHFFSRFSRLYRSLRRKGSA